VPRASLATWRRALRVHQWVKNGLVFLPLLLAHRLGEPGLLGLATLAFVCLSLLTSAVYVLNDLMDLPSDRAHPTKRRRPFAAGTLPIWSGVAVAPLLIAASLGLSVALLPGVFTTALAVYLLLNVIYTGFLKRVAMADVILVASLYSLRVLAGGYATSVEVSPWLIAFSLFFFLNLAFLKRYADLRLMARVAEPGASGPPGSPGRDYVASDAPLLLALGPVSGFMATLVLALYITGEKVTQLYRLPAALWLLIPLLVFWISRFWLEAQRGRMHEDPVVYILNDRLSYAVLAGAAIILLTAALVQP
jgi:4-hydroxybenzoate polyprenyltransferase